MAIKLKTAEAFRSDVGRGIVRVDSSILQSLDVTSGDIVEVSGKRSTVAVVWRGHPQDENLGLIRMDGFTRYNCGAKLGDKIIIKKTNAQEAEYVEFSPAEQLKLSGNFEQYLKNRLLGRVLMQGDRLVVGVLGSSIPFVVSKTSPDDVVVVNEYTKVGVKAKAAVPEVGMPKISYEDIGGLGIEIKKIREMVELPLKHPELFKKLGIEPPKGVLLHGPPGCGKTLLAKAVASESDASFFVINGPEVVSKWYGQSEQNLRKLFKEAEERGPSVIFIDEIDAIAPKRNEVHGEVEKRIVAQLLTLMDGLESRGNVIVIGATNRVDSLDPALRRPGRFDREIIIGVPDKDGRREVLQIHTRDMPLEDGLSMEEVAGNTHGFVGADLAALSREAAMVVLRRILPDIDLDKDEIPAEVLENLVVRKNDFIEALKSVEPSAMREILVEKPEVSWADIGGLEEVKEGLRRIIELPLKEPKVFKRYGIRPARGVLLYGPPGCGKTLLAKAIASESEVNFITVRGPEVMSKWIGESEKAVREIFKKARQVSPCIIFLDEIDSIAQHRGIEGNRTTDRVLNQILTEMDGIEKLENVIVMAATNRPDLIDAAILRPGRFDKIVLVPAPDADTRTKILGVHTKKMPLDADVGINELVGLTQGYSGADLEAVCREAAMEAIAGKDKKVSKGHFITALERVRPSIREEEAKAYEQYQDSLTEAIIREPSYV